MYRPAGSYNSESNMANDYPPYIYNEPKYAFGLLPTITANTGVFGFMTWFLFLLMSLVLIGKKLRHGIGEYDYTAGASLISLCFILSILFIVPQVYLLAIGAIGLGIVAGGSSQHSSRLDLNRLVSTLRLLFTVLLISGAVFLIFFSASLMNSSILFQKAVDVWFYSNSSPLFYAEKTINLREVPEYYRLLGQVQFYTARNYLLNDSALSESDTALVKSLLAESVINISKAADLDPNDYRNWLLLGDINTFLYMFGAEDSAEFADIYYNKVIGLIHAQPYARLGLAQLSYLKGDFDMVEVNLNEALRIFPNWSEALELQDKSNALKEAIINAPVN